MDINELVSTHYNGHSEESLVAEIASLRVQLDQVNLTLDSITLEEGDVQELQLILSQVSSSTCI